LAAFDASKLVAVNDMEGDDADDTALLQGMLEEARSFLLGHRWCGRIAESYFGLGVGGIVAVFLFRIIPVEKQVDEYLWVVVGDLPPLYITTDDAPNAACALDGYVGAMEEWVNAARRGESVQGLAPVSAKPTREMAEQLKSRLEFIDKEILSCYKDDFAR
jgi:hypothetical protein